MQIYTATHPMGAAQRRGEVKFGKTVESGDDVWIGGGSVVLPGVSIGSGSVIGGGSVVTCDIAAGDIAAGNPSRVVSEVSG